MDFITPSFSFDISGLGLSNTTNSDNDGLSDLAEQSLSSLGFDAQIPQTGLVQILLTNASSAGLYTQDTAAVISGKAVLANVDPATNTAIFTLEFQESLDLENFTPITVDPSDIPVDQEGNVRLELDTPAGKRFYRAGFAE